MFYKRHVPILDFQNKLGDLVVLHSLLKFLFLGCTNIRSYNHLFSYKNSLKNTTKKYCYWKGRLGVLGFQLILKPIP